MVNPPERSFAVAMPAFDYKPKPYDGPSYEEMLKTRDKHISKASFMLYREPVFVTDASMQYIYGHDGKRYLDLWAGVCTISVGHDHPRVSGAIRD